MTRSVSCTRNTKLIVATIAASVAFTACHSDSPTGSYAECSGQPGCQEATATVAPEVIQSLEDASSRVLAVLQPSARQSIERYLIQLETALKQRDLAAGRIAFAAAISAISQAERASSESIPDLGVVRLGLVPAARSLGLAVSSAEAATN